MELKRKRVCFLDIDGVLNAWKTGTQRWYEQPVYPFIEDDLPLCQRLVDNLKHVVDSVEDIGIVWSSSWRHNDETKYRRWKNPRLWLESQKWFRKVLIGSNPMKMSSTRPEEISFWLHENEYNQKNLEKAFFEKSDHWKHFMNEPAYDIISYVVIDDYDSPGMHWYDGNLITTSPAQGLTLSLANKAIEILSTTTYKGTSHDQQD